MDTLQKINEIDVLIWSFSHYNSGKCKKEIIAYVGGIYDFAMRTNESNDILKHIKDKIAYLNSILKD